MPAPLVVVVLGVVDVEAPVVLGVLVPGVVVPGALVLGVLVAGVLVAGVLVPGTLVVGVLAPGATAPVVRGVAAVGAVVIVLVMATELEPELPASFTSAAASTPSASATTLASTAIGAFQLGVAASRVRAAAPQFRHHSCSGCSGAPHSGQASLAGARAPGSTGGSPVALGVSVPGVPAGPLVGCAGAAASLTSPSRVGG